MSHQMIDSHSKGQFIRYSPSRVSDVSYILSSSQFLFTTCDAISVYMTRVRTDMKDHSLVFHIRKKVWNSMRATNWWQNGQFGWTIPLKDFLWTQMNLNRKWDSWERPESDSRTIQSTFQFISSTIKTIWTISKTYCTLQWCYGIYWQLNSCLRVMWPF